MAISSRSEGVSNAAVKGLEGLAQFFANLAEGMLDNRRLEVEHERRAILHGIAVKNMPFTDKIDELSKAGSLIEDAGERKRFMDKLEEVEREGQQVKQGLDEVRRYVKKSAMSQGDQDRLCREIDACESSLHNLYVANVPAYTYRQTMKLVNQNGFLNDITAVTLSNGNYALFYPAEHMEAMDKILETAALMYEQHPRPEAVRMEALMTAASKQEAAILRMENVSPELAERAVLEGGKYGFISLAKEERTDGSGNFDLICKAGETRAEKNRNYREMIEIITKSALSLAGPSSKAEMAKMRHSAGEYEKLKEGLEESGYVFSVHTHDQKVGGKRTQMIDVGEFVRFDQEKYRSYHDGIAEKMVVHRAEVDTRYDAMLYAAVQAGTGQKIFISDERMEEIRQDASRVYADLVSTMGDRPVNERLDIIAELQAKSFDLVQQRQEYKNQGNHALQESVTREMRDLSAQAEALSVAGTGKVTETMVFDRLVAAELDTHRFRYYTKDREKTKAADVVQKAIDYGIRATRPEAAKETENRLKREIPGSGKDLSIGWEAIETELDRIKPEDFISHEWSKAAADSDHAAQGQLTVRDVRKESEILDREFAATKEGAVKMLQDIRIRMQEVGSGIDAQSIDTPAAARNARSYFANVEAMDREMTGVETEKDVEEERRETTRQREREVWTKSR